MQPFVHACVSLEQTLLARYLGYLLMELDQTFAITDLWALGMDEHVKFGDQMVKDQGHGGVKYAPKCSFWPYTLCREKSNPLDIVQEKCQIQTNLNKFCTRNS